MRLFALMFAILLLAGCGAEEMKDEKVNTENSIKSTKVAEVEEQEELTVEEEIDIPEERSVPLGDFYPWQFYFASDIENLQKSGEVVYLFSDAEKLEEDLIAFANATYENTEQTKENVADSWVNYVSLFVEEVGQYVKDKTDYFAKMNEVIEALKTYDYESIPNLISEAKNLR